MSGNHGYGGYTNGCRCETCRAAKARYMSARRAAAYLASAQVPANVTHGKRSTYEEHGCRCEACVTAESASSRFAPRQRQTSRRTA